MEADPDVRALLYVQQYLHELGFLAALEALEEGSGLKYDEDKYQRGGELMRLVYAECEAEAAACVDAQDARQRADEAELNQEGAGDYPSRQAVQVEGVHASSVTSVRLWPGRDCLVTGTGAGTVQLVTLAGEVRWQRAVGSGGVLSLHLHPSLSRSADGGSGSGGGGGGAAADAPASSSTRPLLLVGSMDGSVAVVDADTGRVLASQRPHTKYVVRVLWSPDGAHIATASYDHSAALLRLTADGAATTAGGGDEDAAAAEHSGGDAGEGRGGSPLPGYALELVKKVAFSGQVQDVVFVAQGAECIAAVRGSNYLRRLEATTGQELAPVNMNAQGDDHVSFSAMRLALSHCGRYLLVATDGARLLMLRAAGGAPVRSFFGVPHDAFHVPCLAWHRSLPYAFVGAAGAQVLVIHTGSTKVVARLSPAHRINVRDLDYDPATNRLATCSFDKTVNLAELRPLSLLPTSVVDVTSVCSCSPYSTDADGQRRKLVNRLLYRSKQRGFLELDLLVGGWAERQVPIMPPPLLDAYSIVLDEENPDLFKWLTGQLPPPERLQANPAFQALRAHVARQMAETAHPRAAAAAGAEWVRGWDDSWRAESSGAATASATAAAMPVGRKEGVAGA